MNVTNKKPSRQAKQGSASTKANQSKQPQLNTKALAPVNEAQDGDGLRLLIDDESMAITIAIMQDLAQLKEFEDRIAGATTAKLYLDELPNWEQSAAERLLVWAATRGASLKFVAAGKRTLRLSRAITLLLYECEKSDEKRILGYLALVIAVRALDQPVSGDEISELREGYKCIKLQVPQTSSLKTHLNQLREVLIAQATPIPGTAEFQRLLDDHDIAAPLLMPAGYSYSAEGGIRRRGKSVSNSLILVTGLVQSNDGREKWQVTVIRDGQSQRLECAPSELLQTRSVPLLSNYGADVTSENSKAVVRFLRDFRNANADRLPRLQGTTQLGHHEIRTATGKAESVFVLGDRVLTARDGDDAGERIRFVDLDNGHQDWADRWHARGDLASWRKAVSPALSSPVARFAVLAALAAPLLKILGVDNFIVSLSASTSSGKSTVMQIAASVWGMPAVQSGIIRTWQTTAVGIERPLGLLNGLPFFVDETVLAEQTKLNIETIIYMVTEGQTKARGTPLGQTPPVKFSTILLTSGEATLVSLCRHQGILGRVVEVNMPPFGPTSTATREMIDDVRAEMQQHYGVLGPAFVQFLLANEAKWGDWQTRYTEFVAEECGTLGDKPRGHVLRLMQYLAAIRLAAELVKQAVNSSVFLSDPVPMLRAGILAIAEDKDKFAELRERLLNTVQQQRSRYPVRTDIVTNRRDLNGAREADGSVVYFLPTAFKEIVEAGEGLPMDSVQREFANRGWLVMESNASGVRKESQRRFKVKRKFGSERLDVVGIKIPAEQQTVSSLALAAKETVDLRVKPKQKTAKSIKPSTKVKAKPQTTVTMTKSKSKTKNQSTRS